MENRNSGILPISPLGFAGEIENVEFIKSECTTTHFKSKDYTILFAAISDRNEVGIIIVDRNTTLLSGNRAAQSLLEEGNGLMVDGQSVTAASSNEKQLLHDALRQTLTANADRAAKFDPPVLLISRQKRQPLTVSIVPAHPLLTSAGFHPHDADGIPAAVMLITDPASPLTESVRRVCQLYALTPAETRLAELLIDGLTLAEIADAMRLKLSTVRVYLKQIFVKTGVHRQPMLIRMLLTTRIPMAIRS